MSSRYLVRYTAPNSLGGAYTVWADNPEHAHDKVSKMLSQARYAATPTPQWAGPGRKTNGNVRTWFRFDPHATITGVEPA